MLDMSLFKKVVGQTLGRFDSVFLVLTCLDPRPHHHYRESTFYMLLPWGYGMFHVNTKLRADGLQPNSNGLQPTPTYNIFNVGMESSMLSTQN